MALTWRGWLALGLWMLVDIDKAARRPILVWSLGLLERRTITYNINRWRYTHNNE